MKVQLVLADSKVGLLVNGSLIGAGDISEAGIDEHFERVAIGLANMLGAPFEVVRRDDMADMEWHEVIATLKKQGAVVEGETVGDKHVFVVLDDGDTYGGAGDVVPLTDGELDVIDQNGLSDFSDFIECLEEEGFDQPPRYDVAKLVKIAEQTGLLGLARV